MPSTFSTWHTTPAAVPHPRCSTLGYKVPWLLHFPSFFLIWSFGPKQFKKTPLLDRSSLRAAERRPPLPLWPPPWVQQSPSWSPPFPLASSLPSFPLLTICPSPG